MAIWEKFGKKAVWEPWVRTKEVSLTVPDVELHWRVKPVPRAWLRWYSRFIRANRGHLVRARKPECFLGTAVFDPIARCAIDPSVSEWVRVEDLPPPSAFTRTTVINSLQTFKQVEGTIEVLIDKKRGPDGKFILPIKECRLTEIYTTWVHSAWALGLDWKSEIKWISQYDNAEDAARAVKDKAFDCSAQLLGTGPKPFPKASEFQLSTMFRAGRALPCPPIAKEPWFGLEGLLRPPRANVYTYQYIQESMSRMDGTFHYERDGSAFTSVSAVMEFTRKEGGMNKVIDVLSKAGVQRPETFRHLKADEERFLERDIIQGLRETEAKWDVALANSIPIARRLFSRNPRAFKIDVPERGWKHRVPVFPEAIVVILSATLGELGRDFLQKHFGATYRRRDFIIGNSQWYTSGDYSDASQRGAFFHAHAFYDWVIDRSNLEDRQFWKDAVRWMYSSYDVFEDSVVREKLHGRWMGNEYDPVNDYSTGMRLLYGASSPGPIGRTRAKIQPMLEHAPMRVLGQTVWGVVKTDTNFRIMWDVLADRLMEPLDFEHVTTQAGWLQALSTTQPVLFMLNHLPHHTLSIRNSLELGDDNVSGHKTYEDALELERHKAMNGMDINEKKSLISDRGYTIAQEHYIRREHDGFKWIEHVPSFTLRQLFFWRDTLGNVNDFLNKLPAVIENLKTTPEKFKYRALSLIWHSQKKKYLELYKLGLDIMHPKYGLFKEDLRVVGRTSTFANLPHSIARMLFQPYNKEPVSLRRLVMEWDSLTVPEEPWPLLGSDWSQKEIRWDTLVGTYTASIADPYRIRDTGQLPFRATDALRKLELKEDVEFDKALELVPERITTRLRPMAKGLDPSTNRGVPLHMCLVKPIVIVDFSNVGGGYVERLVERGDWGTLYLAMDDIAKEYATIETIRGEKKVIVRLTCGGDRNVIGMLRWFERKGIEMKDILVHTGDRELSFNVQRRGAKVIKVGRREHSAKRWHVDIEPLEPFKRKIQVWASKAERGPSLSDIRKEISRKLGEAAARQIYVIGRDDLGLPELEALPELDPPEPVKERVLRRVKTVRYQTEEEWALWKREFIEEHGEPILTAYGDLCTIKEGDGSWGDRDQTPVPENWYAPVEIEDVIEVEEYVEPNKEPEQRVMVSPEKALQEIEHAKQPVVERPRFVASKLTDIRDGAPFNLEEGPLNERIHFAEDGQAFIRYRTRPRKDRKAKAARVYLEEGQSIACAYWDRGVAKQLFINIRSIPDDIDFVITQDLLLDKDGHSVTKDDVPEDDVPILSNKILHPVHSVSEELQGRSKPGHQGATKGIGMSDPRVYTYTSERGKGPPGRPIENQQRTVRTEPSKGWGGQQKSQPRRGLASSSDNWRAPTDEERRSANKPKDDDDFQEVKGRKRR